jgi:hypothetical protein
MRQLVTNRMVVLFLVVAALEPVWSATKSSPLVLNVFINYSVTPNQIIINGGGFSNSGLAPTVILNNGSLAPLVSFTATTIVANLPRGIPAGSELLVITNSDGLSVQFEVAFGEVGPQGPMGPQGLTGATGPAGPQGQQGPSGATGAIGPAGPTGAIGPAGPTGAIGPAGPSGPAGPTGPAGPAGPIGTQGPQGNAGPAGPTAAGACADNANRFVDCGNGTVTDTQTGLIWLKHAACYSTATATDFATANNTASTLQSGQCGLTDGSAAGSWRLPTDQEWAALVQPQCANDPAGPAIPNKAGTGCYSNSPWATVDWESPVTYWSSTTLTAYDPSYGQFAQLQGGQVAGGPKFNHMRIWPVRSGGQPGATGPQGVQGLTGATGPAGPQGPIGPIGLQGPQGAQGLLGPAGPQGPQGPAGLISSLGDFCNLLGSDYISQAAAGCMKIVFATAATYDGALGGVANANAICQKTAVSAGLPGRYKVWLSDSLGASPSTTFAHSQVPYELQQPDGSISVNWANWNVLTSNNPPAALDRDEFGQIGALDSGSGIAWTGTNSNGTPASPNCQNWTSNSSGDYGAAGFTNNNGGYWSYWPNWNGAPGQTCDTQHHLYCFQQ